MEYKVVSASQKVEIIKKVDNPIDMMCTKTAEHLDIPVLTLNNTMLNKKCNA
jgi:hypothetical protein